MNIFNQEEMWAQHPHLYFKLFLHQRCGPQHIITVIISNNHEFLTIIFRYIYWCEILQEISSIKWANTRFDESQEITLDLNLKMNSV